MVVFYLKIKKKKSPNQTINWNITKIFTEINSLIIETENRQTLYRYNYSRTGYRRPNPLLLVYVTLFSILFSINVYLFKKFIILFFLSVWLTISVLYKRYMCFQVSIVESTIKTVLFFLLGF